MLKNLFIENYALIDKLSVSFSSKFNVITGETGAGKSILVGALSLLSGQRADASILFNNNTKCIVEGYFDLEGLNLEQIFIDNELDYEPNLIIRREINSQGKSRGFINDTPVNLNVMKIISSKIFDIHSQHQNYLINNSDFQINIIDKYANNSLIKNEYIALYKELKKTNNKLSELQELDNKSKQEKDYYVFLYNEIKEVNPKENEIEILENEYHILSNAEEIKTALSKTFNHIQENDISIEDLIIEIKNGLYNSSKYHLESEVLLNRIESTFIELKDISKEAKRLSENINFDNDRMYYVENRLNVLNRLMLKHKLSETIQLIDLFDEFEKKINLINNIEDEILKTQTELKIIKNKIEISAKNLTKTRKDNIFQISNIINQTIHQLGMKDSEILIEVNEADDYNINGKDEIKFLFLANKGHIPQEVNKIASGGELSRIMLSIKNLTSTKNLIPTVIFDEIDTGVSGEIAAKVANILKIMSHNTQIIAISHLPQIASQSDNHFWIYKELTNNITITKIKELNNENRINEIAKMISGEKVSEISLQAAKELIKK